MSGADVGTPPGGTGCCLGVDVGGTFTDVVLRDPDGQVHLHKVLTTPDDPRRGVRRGVQEILDRSGVRAEQVTRLVHGTTLATNVILERRGARVAFVTTAGFGDLLRLGREARVEGDRYDLRFRKPVPPVPGDLTFEVDERMGASGEVVRILDPAEAAAVAGRVRDANPDAVAICLLNAHVNPAHERAFAAACRAALPDRYVVTSSDVWPEQREYDRAVTTVLTASVGPVMGDYLAGLRADLAALGLGCPVEVMESSGGVIRAELAARRPLATVESGGAAGVTASGYIGSTSGLGDVISFDMGGTTAKAGVLQGGQPDITHDFQVGGKGSFGSTRPGTGLPVKLPVVDLAEVGAGGGSIAWIDPTGALRVGPRSAGADPGPACYGRGGDAPTVTDANLVLGYLAPEGLADDLRLDRDAAGAAIERHVADPLGIDLVTAAWAIHDLVTETMAAAIHVVTVQRGIDPRPFALVAHGGAGPLHAARLAERFGIRQVIVPWVAGVASAVGLCAADLTVHGLRPHQVALDAADPSRIEAVFQDLEVAGRTELAGHEGHGGHDHPDRDRDEAASWVTVRAVDVRYQGQAHQLTIEVAAERFDPEALALTAKAFRDRYRQLYGIEPGGSLEIVNLRTTVTRLVDKIRLPTFDDSVDALAATVVGARPDLPRVRLAHFGSGNATATGTGPSTAAVATGMHRWEGLAPGATLAGPAIVEGAQTTVLVPPGHRADVDRYRNLILAPHDEERCA